MTEEVKYNAPGKIILSGEHSVAHGKAAIAAAIDIRCHVSFSSWENLGGAASTTLSFQLDCFHKLCFVNGEILELFPVYFSNGKDEVISLPSKDHIEVLAKFVSKHTSEKFLALAAQCFLHCLLFTCASQHCLEVLKNRNFRVSIISDVPLGAGLGSSAAFNTATAACILDLFGGLNSPRGSSLVPEDQKKVNELAFAAEHIVHGKPSGVDTYVSCYGRPILFDKQSFQEQISMPAFQILVVNTKEERNTRVLVDKVGKLKEDSAEVFHTLIDQMDACTKTISSILKSADSDLSKVWKDFTEQIAVNHDLLGKLGVSTEKLNKIVEIAGSEGCPAKLTGAGGGGCAIVILPPNWENDLPELKQSLYKKFAVLGCDVLPATLSSEGVKRAH